MAGKLYVVATPLGNLEDITLRALRVLKEVELIACEDTRRTRKLLTHYGISTRTVSYHEHNERERARQLASRLEEGADIALVSDAGTPAVSDPGYSLVNEAIKRSIEVVPVPGPSAITAALAASGLTAGEFVFAGFLPPRSAGRRSRLVQLATLAVAIVIYEAPHRIKATLKDALEVLGDRDCVLAREITKVHEEFVRGRLSDLSARLAETEPRGEFVLLIAAPVRDNPSVSEARARRSISQEVEALMLEEGIDQKSALKRTARSRGISKSAAYRLMLREREGK